MTYGEYPLIRRLPFEISHAESPETAIARQIPHLACKLLDRESQRKHYTMALGIGASVAVTYLNRSSEENISRLKRIRIDPERRRFFGLGSKGMVIEFEK